mmetsp:Transcript_43762/g.140328  ORF Transcript_43762/g.140328 Transcript_43762/m.140328 type:complete len:172 (-) Transcript_43762:119-634(-)|eukprot:CAMPEP_0203962918 /NCGR_PEP_ID=MMETSP0359-20131031/92987_1 /ASSEMBLY_ACC=CAM_ASM_000338 /TAXON_ID=268821 /ORGANISM="Scrippsiella Hangoei, Strain SHTV-5" /LENGTH=171 /DNA_ID=CAMNT_0050898473 /DNA_START=69 /DNA_END=584 /DNA_ORIENTATION=-
MSGAVANPFILASSKSLRFDIPEEEKCTEALGHSAGEKAEDTVAPKLPNFRSAVVVLGDDEDVKQTRTQRTAMLPYDSEATIKGGNGGVGSPGLDRQRTAMLSDIRVSRTAMLPYMPDKEIRSPYVTENPELAESPIAKAQPESPVVKVASDAAASVQNLFNRSMRVLRSE